VVRWPFAPSYFGKPRVSSVSGSKATGSGDSVRATKRPAIRAMLTRALSAGSGKKRLETRLKSDRHGSVANSPYVIRPVSIAFWYAWLLRNLFA
jgi:hypothetical protein